MKRNNWLIAIFTALFVLQAPICAMACLDQVAPSPDATAASDHGGCHDEVPDPSSSDVPSSHDECGCASAETVVVSQSNDVAASLLQFVVSIAIRFDIVESHAPRSHSILAAADLPPPDILLRKSTLNI